jgi:hypothetical protein
MLCFCYFAGNVILNFKFLKNTSFGGFREFSRESTAFQDEDLSNFMENIAIMETVSINKSKSVRLGRSVIGVDDLATRLEGRFNLSQKQAIEIAKLTRVFYVLHTMPTSQIHYNTSPLKVLLLGMVFATELRPNKRGQEYRDRVRCEALENRGFDVRTLDNKHCDKDLRKHCHASFTDFRRMKTNMREKWGETTFDHLILDYFFSPVRNFICTMYTQFDNRLSLS